jgi:hypothetical protein
MGIDTVLGPVNEVKRITAVDVMGREIIRAVRDLWQWKGGRPDLPTLNRFSRLRSRAPPAERPISIRAEGVMSMAVKPTEMDERVTFMEQLQQETGPVVLINKFNLAPADVEQFLPAWSDMPRS